MKLINTIAGFIVILLSVGLMYLSSWGAYFVFKFLNIL